MIPIRQSVAFVIVSLLILVLAAAASWFIGDTAQTKKIIDSIAALVYVVLLLAGFYLFWKYCK